MTKFRSSLLILLVLTAMGLSAVGVGSVWAARWQTYPEPEQQASKHDPPAGIYSGEPDAGGGPAPQRPAPTVVTPANNTDLMRSEYLRWLWALLLSRRP